MKAALFQLINYHGWFVYVAFWKKDMEYLHSQLVIFFTVKQLIGNFMEVCVPMLKAAFALKGKGQPSRQLRQESGACLASDAASPKAKPEASKLLRRTIEENYLLPEADLWDDYVEMAVMFATVTFYAPVFPLAGLFAVIH